MGSATAAVYFSPSDNIVREIFASLITMCVTSKFYNYTESMEQISEFLFSLLNFNSPVSPRGVLGFWGFVVCCLLFGVLLFVVCCLLFVVCVCCSFVMITVRV